ncbi:gamma-glutamyl-gamma-aminobutyrate hydrolase family protein [Candidatus Nomurabacteria bacterium]|nr:gamma-glutamyl-gamma-aminobutyrate hydrolase family protein [Candidatus Nomurabacteria bacterium]
MKILLVDNHTKNLEETKKLFSGLDFLVSKKEEFSNDFANTFDLIIFLGGSGVNSVKNHREDYKNEIDFISNTDKKIIGICLGCEIVATSFNCTLKELEAKEKGISIIKFENEEIPIYEAHRFVIDKVSDEIEILATSNHGIEMIKHKTKPIYGLQFHPEMFVDKTRGNEIFFNILNNI